MARENRADNRKKAKEFESDFTELLDTLEGDEDDAAGSGDKLEDDAIAEEEIENEEADANATAVKKTAAESEIVGENKTPKAVEKKGEEEVKKSEEGEKVEKKAEEPAPTKVEEPAKKLEETSKEPEPAKKAEPTSIVEKKEEKKQPEVLNDEDAAKLFSEWRNTTEDLLAKSHYRLTEKDVESFNENPAEFIPRAMSRVYLDSIQAAFQQFVTYIPRMVDQVLVARTQRSEKENQFYAKWPDLKPHSETVLRLGAAYRTSNPTATLEDFINEVGAQAMVALRMPIPGTQSSAEPQGKTPAFKPAVSSSTPTPIKPQSNNPFERLAEEFSFEDLPEQ